jgi:hypothetical protein
LRFSHITAEGVDFTGQDEKDACPTMRIAPSISSPQNDDRCPHYPETETVFQITHNRSHTHL